MSTLETMPDTSALFGVEQSLGGHRWTLRPGDDRQAAALVQQHNLPDLVARILAARGLTAETAEDFLNPSLRAQLPDPLTLRDMDKAIARVSKAVRADEPIAVFGDYDVDGATSSALLLRYLRAVGAEPTVYIPDRKAEGYGPNLPALEKLAGAGAKVVLTVDCGVTAFEPLAGARKLGLDVVVLDHHVAEPALPEAVAVVNPNRLDEDGTLKQLAACGVTYLFLVGLNRQLRQEGHFSTARPEPNLLDLLDLVALGTVADIVPLTGLNRVFVAQGLKVMAKRANPGLAALADVGNLAERPEAWHLGFIFGPRVNAGGRVGEAGLGVRLLTTDSAAEARPLAEQLDHYNQERRAIESMMLEEALAKAEAQADAPFLLVACHSWHIGVIGIVAGRLKERFNKPAFVIAFEKGVGKGSGRSVKGFDIGAATIAARQAGLLLNGGGHPMAAGLTVAEENLSALHAFFSERALTALGPAPVPEYMVDAVLSLGGVTPDLLTDLERLAPYGSGNYEPRLAFSHLRVAFAKPIGKSGDHLSVTFASREGARLKAVAFNIATSPLGQQLLNAGDRLFHVAGTVRIDTWQGRREPKLYLDDLAPA